MTSTGQISIFYSATNVKKVITTESSRMLTELTCRYSGEFNMRVLFAIRRATVNSAAVYFNKAKVTVASG